MMTEDTMTLLFDQIQASTDGDFLRAIAAHTLQRLMEFEVDSLIGAGRHERSDERTTYRNGHRDRQSETRLGTLDLKIPKLRQGTYFPAFLEPRKVGMHFTHLLARCSMRAWLMQAIPNPALTILALFRSSRCGLAVKRRAARTSAAFGGRTASSVRRVA